MRALLCAVLSTACLTVAACGAPATPPGMDAGLGDAGAADGGSPDAGGADAGPPPFDGGQPLPDGGAALANVPELVICAPAADPWVHQTEMSPGPTHYQRCATVCPDWSQCSVESTVRGRPQLELFFVVDEDGSGNGFGGTLRFTKSGDRAHVVVFHKGGAGTQYVDDFLPQKVEDAGGTYLEPKWVEAVDTKVGWFSRPFAGSRLERNLYGVSARPAAVLKWAFRHLATGRLSTAGCSGGSIATYYPRHWHGLDALLRYQLLSGGPVMSKIQAGCGSAEVGRGRCTLVPTLECTQSADCGPTGGTCTPYRWKRPDLIMSAVRGTIDHLHEHETGGSNDCTAGNAQPLYDVSDFDAPAHGFDAQNEHPMDFMMNIGDPGADDFLNVAASGAAVYAGLTGAKTWTVQTSGVHCDTFKTEEAWNLLRAGAGL